jgi:flagellar biosynthesis protein FlhF
MNVQRFTARTPREAMKLVRQAFGDDAVVLSTRPSAGGVDVLAMAPESLSQIEKMGHRPPAPRAVAAGAAAAAHPASADTVQRDVEQLAMSTLSFQDYVRERMLKRRQAEIESPAPPADKHNERAPLTAAARLAAQRAGPPPLLSEEIRYVETPSLANAAESADAVRRERAMMNELRQVKGLIEERFGALAFMEKLQRSPQRANLTQKLFDCGFSPVLIRQLVEALPADCTDESAWAAAMLARNLSAAESQAPIEDAGGVYALIGATGVGKTTSTAKIAAAFATQHGSANLGLITLDAYRVGAQEQLRTYGRILGVPVHTAHDRASLEDLLDLLAGKKMVLIDTAGMAQRDARTRELLDMLGHRSIQKLLVINAAAQGETNEDVMVSYRAATCRGLVLSKIDEAVKLGPALDAVIRHRLKVIGVANGQRVPEDWHRLSAQALVQRALRAHLNPSWKLDASEVNLVFAGKHAGDGAAPAAAHHA